MKALKFNHESAQLILAGKKNTTWRLFDDKNLSVDDEIKIIDKVDPKSSSTWRVIGQGRINQITEKKLTDVTDPEMNEQGYKSKDETLETYQKYYGNRVTPETTVKIVNFIFSPTTGDIPAPAMLLEEAKLYTDGGSRGNPGDSACAFVVCDPNGTVVEKSGFYLGVATNNQAEYYGLQKGLERARELGINRITLFSDSQLVVNQMNGLYKVKNQELAPLHQQVTILAKSFEKITFIHVPREVNKIADQEVNRILDQQAKRAK